MSNLVKGGGFQSFNSKEAKPYVIDFNNRKFGENAPKVIRSVNEEGEENTEAEPEQNEIVLQDALDKAKMLRDDAMLKSAQILSDANAEAEQIRENAYQEGFEKGLEEGNMEAMRRADEYLANIQAEQEAEIAAIQSQMEEAYAENCSKLVDLSCQLISKFTGILVSDYKPVMLYMINEALRESDTSRQFTIKVSEGNYIYVSDNSDRLVGAANPGINIEVYGDANLKDDQCIIETDNGIIDLSMDVQIKNLVTAIKLLSE